MLAATTSGSLGLGDNLSCQTYRQVSRFSRPGGGRGQASISKYVVQSWSYVINVLNCGNAPTVSHLPFVMFVLAFYESLPNRFLTPMPSPTFLHCLPFESLPESIDIYPVYLPKLFIKA